MYSKQKIALVYDRVNKWGGAERVILMLHKMFPDAPLYTSVYDPKNAPWAKVFPRVITSFLQKIPFAKSKHEFLAPFMPFAFESFDFSSFDLVISVTSEAAKGIKTGQNTVHICYCLTPTRYLWSGYNDYFRDKVLKVVSNPLITHLRIWDKKAAKRPDVIVSISSIVQKRIKKYYGRSSEIIFPPVGDVTLHNMSVKNNRNYYLIVSRLDFGYKKVDLAIRTFNDLNLPLIIVGSGRLQDKLKQISNKNIKFVGRVSESKLSRYYKKAKALVMPQEEDFGLVAVEAQTFGIPVIAYQKGGAQDTVVDGKTGVLFDKQNKKSLKDAVLRFEKMHFKADNLHTNAKRFSKKKFRQNFAKIIQYATKRR